METVSNLSQRIFPEGLLFISPDYASMLLYHPGYHDNGNIVLDDLNQAIRECNDVADDGKSFLPLTGKIARFSYQQMQLITENGRGESLVVFISEFSHVRSNQHNESIDNISMTTTGLVIDTTGKVLCIAQVTSDPRDNVVYTPLETAEKHRIVLRNSISGISRIISATKNLYKNENIYGMNISYVILNDTTNEALAQFMSDLREWEGFSVIEILKGTIFRLAGTALLRRKLLRLGIYLNDLRHQIIQ